MLRLDKAGMTRISPTITEDTFQTPTSTFKALGTQEEAVYPHVGLLPAWVNLVVLSKR